MLERSRGRATVSLTTAGEALLAHADAIVSHIAAAKADLERLVDGDTTTLRVGVSESVSTRLLPGMLSLLAQREPDLHIVPSELASWQKTSELLNHGELDASFAYLPLDPGPFECVELLSSPCMLLVQADSPLARRGEPPELADIARLPLVDHPVWRFMPRLRVILEATGYSPRFPVCSNLNGAVQSLVAAGVAAAILPRLAIDLHRDDTVAIDLSGILPPARLVVSWHRDRHQPRLASLVTAAREVSGKLDHEHHSAGPKPVAA